MVMESYFNVHAKPKPVKRSNVRRVNEYNKREKRGSSYQDTYGL
jgi:hypothetical protein